MYEFFIINIKYSYFLHLTINKSQKNNQTYVFEINNKYNKITKFVLYMQMTGVYEDNSTRLLFLRLCFLYEFFCMNSFLLSILYE